MKIALTKPAVQNKPGKRARYVNSVEDLLNALPSLEDGSQCPQRHGQTPQKKALIAFNLTFTAASENVKLEVARMA